MKQQITLKRCLKTQSLTDQKLYTDLHDRLERLGKQLNMFIQSVERSHISER